MFARENESARMGSERSGALRFDLLAEGSLEANVSRILRDFLATCHLFRESEIPWRTVRLLPTSITRADADGTEVDHA